MWAIRQKVSKSSNLRRTSISRVSICIKPAPCQSAREVSMRDASRLGGQGGDAPSARISSCSACIRKAAAEDVPRIGRDAAARADHARHLGDALRRIGNEEDHQRHDRGVERVVGEGQRHRVAVTELAPRVPRAACARRRAAPRDGSMPCTDGRRAALDEQLGERAVAAADVDPAQARARREPVEEDVAGEPAPLPIKRS